MLSIRTNENGDFVFDVRIRKPDNSIEIGELVMPCSKENIESIANWFYYNLGFSQCVTYRFLQELREFGREKLLENIQFLRMKIFWREIKICYGKLSFIKTKRKIGERYECRHYRPNG